MEVPKRDRGLVRTAKDLEVKYNLSEMSRLRKESGVSRETVDGLVKDNEELSMKYDVLESEVRQNAEGIEVLEVNKADKDDIEELEERKADKIEIPSIDGLAEEEYVKDEIQKINERMNELEKRVLELEDKGVLE